ncbi:hypothetical protein [Klebsiella pneumoniae]|uniref:hypothetical protein n=1 Tax=Klebsiella pneumoniae TaxID=573 RepID=UPI000D1A872F|nr:hypothetical protein [Klebsiella pneumoniae]
MLALTRTELLQFVIPKWQEKISRVLFKLKNEYPGNNCDLLGRQLIVALNLKTGVSGMVNGVLFNVVGKLTDTETLSLYFLQPHADTEVIAIDLKVIDALFLKRKQEDWK